MNDDTTPPGTPGDVPGASGNRWEPATDQPAGDETAPLAGRPVGPPPTTTPYADGPVAAPVGPSWRDRVRLERLGPRARTGIAAGAAALVVGGIGGFAIGQATVDGAGDGRGTFDGRGFDGHGRDGFPPQGQLPGQPGQPGQPPGQLPGQQGGSTGELPDQDGTDS